LFRSDYSFFEMVTVLFLEVLIINKYKPKNSTVTPIHWLTVITSPSITYARIVAIIGSNNMPMETVIGRAHLMTQLKTKTPKKVGIIAKPISDNHSIVPR